MSPQCIGRTEPLGTATLVARVTLHYYIVHSSLLLWIMAWVLLWLLLETSNSCPTISCVSDLPTSQCFQQDFSSDEINLQTCPSGLLCQFNQMDNMQSYDFQAKDLYCVQRSELIGKKFPGEPCSLPTECLSSKCASGVCQGLPQRSPCTDFANCAPGLVCWSGFCAPQVPLGGACAESWQCVNNGLCAQGHCVRYFSQALSLPIMDTPQVCESGYEEKGVCASPPSNENAPDELCSRSSDCPLSNGKDGYCWCGFNTDGMAFCMSQPGDQEYKMLKNTLLATIDASVGCHYNISMTPRCPQQAQDPNFPDYQAALYIYYYRPIIISVPQCVIDAMPFAVNYTYTYSQVSPADSSTNSTTVIVVAICVFVALICLGFLCFLCVRRFVKQDAREQAVLRRIRDNEFLILEVFLGNPPAEPPASPPEGKFTFSNLELSEKNRRNLVTGIPVSLPVHEETHALLEEEIEEAPLAEARIEKHRPSSSATNPSSAHLSPLPRPS